VSDHTFIVYDILRAEQISENIKDQLMDGIGTFGFANFDKCRRKSAAGLSCKVNKITQMFYYATTTTTFTIDRIINDDEIHASVALLACVGSDSIELIN